MALPRRSWLATKSRESSEIWKATPMSSPYRRQRLHLLERDPTRTAPPMRQQAEMNEAVFWVMILRIVGLGGESAALALQLEHLGLGHRHGRAGQRLHDPPVVVADEHGEGLGVQMVADQHGRVVAPAGVGRGAARGGSGAWSTTSSWIKVAVWSSSTTQANRTERGPRYPARRAASSRSIGRSRLPPAPAMYAPISWMSTTGEPSWRRISPSTACKLLADERGDTLLEDLFEGRGGHAGAAYLGTTRSLIWMFGAWSHRLDLGDREPLAQLGHPGRADLLVELTEHLARHRMHDGDAVAPQADHGPGPHAVGGDEVDDDPGRVHVDDEAPLGLGGRQRRRRRSGPCPGAARRRGIPRRRCGRSPGSCVRACPGAG